MAIKSAIIPWLSGGGVLLLGYAAFACLRGKGASALGRAKDEPQRVEPEVEPLAPHLEHLPEQLVLDFEELEAAPPSETRLRQSALGASFLARACLALSPVDFGTTPQGSTR